MNPQMWNDLQRFYPEMTISLALLAVVIVDIGLPSVRKALTFLIAAAGLAAAFLFTLELRGSGSGTLFYRMLAMDPMAVFFKGFIILASFMVLLAAPGSKEFRKSHLGEFYSLLLGVTLGMLLLASSVDMLMLYLSLEMVSITSYVMVGYLHTERQSNEASLKYLLFGAVSTGSMLYGISLLFGLTGSTNLYDIQRAVASGVGGGGNTLPMLVATVLIMAGFGFKTAAVPFHFWCPDVYSGAPTPVTAFLSVAPKAAGFAALVRFFFSGLAETSSNVSTWSVFTNVDWTVLLLLVSIVTMTFGNIAALRQDNLKRMLAYSSIAHAGYILMGAVVLTPEGLQAILIYLITYLFMNLGSFLVVIEIYNTTGSFDIKDYRGLYQRSPFLTLSMTAFLLSLMGIPPFAGFFGKLFVFSAAVNQNLAWFAVVGALNSVIAVYYYMRVIRAMILEPGEDASAIRISWMSQALVWVMLLPTAGLVIFWDWVQRLTGELAVLYRQ